MELGDDLEANRREGQGESTRLNVDENVSVFFHKAFPAVNVFLVFTFIMKFPGWSISSIVYMACLVLSFIIHLVMIEHVAGPPGRWRWMIACLSTFLRMSAAAALLLFLDTHHAVVVLPVLLLILVIVLGSYSCLRGTSYFRRGHQPGINWGMHKEQLEVRFHMTAPVVSMAFGGLSGKLLGFNNSVPTGGYAAVALAPEYILFYSLVIGLLVLLVCTVPPRVKNRSDRDSMVIHLRVVTYAALSLLVLASVVAAQGIEQMQKAVFIECFAIAVVALIKIFHGYRTGDSPTDSGPHIPLAALPGPANSFAQALRQAYVKYTDYLVSAYFTSVFAAIVASYSKYGMESGSTVPLLSWWFKGFVFFAVCSILCFTIHIVLQAEMPYTTSWALFRKACSVAAVTTLVFAFLVLFLRPDEFKSILI